MAKTKEQKKSMMAQYKDALKDNPNYILVDTDKVGMTEITELKKALSESDGTFFVVKNTIFKIAAEEAGQPTKVQEISDATGIIICGEDPTAAAKALKDVQREHEVMETRFAVLFGDIAEASKVDDLAEIPPKEVLLGQLVGLMNGPLSGFAHAIQGNIRDFVYALSEIQKTKGGASELTQEQST